MGNSFHLSFENVGSVKFFFFALFDFFGQCPFLHKAIAATYTYTHTLASYTHTHTPSHTTDSFQYSHAQGTLAELPCLHPLHLPTPHLQTPYLSRLPTDPPSGKPQHGANRRLYFDVSDVPLDHSLLGAEIRVHRLTDHPQPVRLHVYLITDEEGYVLKAHFLKHFALSPSLFSKGSS
ncbi:hypothetical protein E2C01_082419 [Portunus trituberculatus]|uniref:Uncharacterized protein n=1 Tax=Portunus trituberculatus TaxID=210409 RepID=A0A5B7J4X0_PORTR|nr:hypothetical protein [Portunus trituberculatus]